MNPTDLSKIMERFDKLETLISEIPATNRIANKAEPPTATVVKTRKDEILRLFNMLANMDADRKASQCFPLSLRIRGVQNGSCEVVPLSVLKNRSLLRKCFRLYGGEHSKTEVFMSALKSVKELEVMTLEQSGINNSKNLCVFSVAEATKCRAENSNCVPDLPEEERLKILAEKAKEPVIKMKEEKGKMVPEPTSMWAINVADHLAEDEPKYYGGLHFSDEVDTTESDEDAAPQLDAEDFYGDDEPVAEPKTKKSVL